MNTALDTSLEEEVEVENEPFTLTTDQQKALEGLQLFLMDPIETVFVLQGYSGCGKSTLIRTFIKRLPGIFKVAKLINPSQKIYEVALTATTNKAAENLAQITGMEARTIHSFLGLRVVTDRETRVSKLVAKNTDVIQGMLVFVDEASISDKELLGRVFTRTRACKIIFIGDPAQLTGVKAVGAPVFDAGFSGAALTQVVRQAEGNPIVDLSTKFRQWVTTGVMTAFKPDGHHVVRLDRDAFNKAIEVEFTRPGWKHQDSKILGWTNRCVDGYNKFVRNLAMGDPNLQVGDYAVCNSFLTAGKQSLKTDEVVQITDISEDFSRLDVLGNMIEVNHVIKAFQPKSLEAKKARIKQARADRQFALVEEMESNWIDLRGAAACTINKAQGSTYDKVFIDLDDISACHITDQVARMLYVGVSRARNHVYLTGDLA